MALSKAYYLVHYTEEKTAQHCIGKYVCIDYTQMEVGKIGFTERNLVWIILSQRTMQ